jgi:hypothetical protein
MLCVSRSLYIESSGLNKSQWNNTRYLTWLNLLWQNDSILNFVIHTTHMTLILEQNPHSHCLAYESCLEAATWRIDQWPADPVGPVQNIFFPIVHNFKLSVPIVQLAGPTGGSGPQSLCVSDYKRGQRVWIGESHPCKVDENYWYGSLLSTALSEDKYV